MLEFVSIHGTVHRMFYLHDDIALVSLGGRGEPSAARGVHVARLLSIPPRTHAVATLGVARLLHGAS